MTRLYIYILCVSACVDSISAFPHITTVSAPVGSTVVLPCKLTHAFNQISAVRWSTDDDVVFERSSDSTDVGSGYEGRVDVPEDELRKGNCSLVLKNIRLTDDGVYKTFVMEHIDTKTTEWKEVNKVQLSVKDQTEERSDKKSDSSDHGVKKNHYYVLIPFILVVFSLFGLVVWGLIKHRDEVPRLLFSYI